MSEKGENGMATIPVSVETSTVYFEVVEDKPSICGAGDVEQQCPGCDTITEGTNDRLSKSRLMFATVFCLVWNVATTVVWLALIRSALKPDASEDLPNLFVLVLTGMPFLLVGSVLMWLVATEWMKRSKDASPGGPGKSGGLEDYSCRQLGRDPNFQQPQTGLVASKTDVETGDW